MKKESLKKIWNTLKSLNKRVDDLVETSQLHAEKIDELHAGHLENNIIFEHINENLIKINESLSSILVLSTNKKPTTDATPVKNSESILPDNKEQSGEHSGGVGILGKLAGGIAFTLFAIFPVVLRWIQEKRDKISDFLNPVFEFIFEGVIPFFTEKIPNFFIKDIPEYFSEKFDVVKDFTSNFLGDIQKTFLGWKKLVGETIVSLANNLPDWDFLKSTKESLKKYGADMASSAVDSIEVINTEQAKTQAKRDQKKRMDILLEQADSEGKRVVEANKGKGYKAFVVKPDFNKGLVTIEYKVDGTDGVSEVDQLFDANKSMETGTLVEKRGGEPRAVKGDNGGTPVKDKEGQSITSVNDGTPESAASSSGQEKSASSIKGQTEGGATPEINQEVSNKGNKLDVVSKDNENPPSAKSKSSAPPVVSIPSTGQKVRMLSGQGPHDINDVPDPTPFLGYMADQLFYNRA